MEPLFAILMGTGLAAASGFRIFVPMLVVSLASRSGHMELASSFNWLASDGALLMLSAATVVEIGSYYIPWLDNLLDTIATPTAVVAGAVASASAVSGMSPMFAWIIAGIGGGTIAGGVQLATVATRAASSALTGGLGNPLVSTGEAASSVAISAMAVLLPILILVVIAVAAYLIVKWVRRRRRRREMLNPQPAIE